MSPSGAASTLITSAPISANIREQVGPASARDKSSTRRPVSTCSMGPAILISFTTAITNTSHSWRPAVEIETLGQLHEHHPRRPVDHSRDVITLAGKIIGDKRHVRHT